MHESNTTIPPPAKVPAVLFKVKLAYSFWLNFYRKFPKPERFGIGEKIDILFLDTLELAFQIRFAPVHKKLILIDELILKIDKLKFFCEIAWENRLLSSKNYGDLLSKLQEIGKELGGWKKNLTKTPT